jgi:hypothetical protein
MITISKPKLEDAEDIHKVMKASWYATYPNTEIGVTKEDGDMSYTPDIEQKQIEVLPKFFGWNWKNPIYNKTEMPISQFCPILRG